jgi:hypothetical protein
MTDSSAPTGLFRAMARAPSPELDIPLLSCPVCEKRRPMTIKSVSPRLRTSAGARVEYQCVMCGEIERRIAKPV